VRRDIADLALADRLFAPHYARAEPRACVAPSAMLRAAPKADAPAVSQLLAGEGFAVLDIAAGWAWGYCLHDRYVGYLPVDALGAPVDATHIVTASTTLLFSQPDIKSAVRAVWPMGARFTGVESDSFIACEEGYLHRRHVGPAASFEEDPVAVAERLTGLPYLWGGRGGGGIDCSGLVQVALARINIAAPRDTDQQEAVLGFDVADGEPLRRGDLIFFPGHVGFMVDGERLIHANAWSMDVLVEPLDTAIARLAPNHDRPVTARRRLIA
jgi:hypothetical protein